MPLRFFTPNAELIFTCACQRIDDWTDLPKETSTRVPAPTP